MRRGAGLPQDRSNPLRRPFATGLLSPTYPSSEHLPITPLSVTLVSVIWHLGGNPFVFGEIIDDICQVFQQ